MPDKAVLTAEEVGALEGWSEQHVHRTAQRKGWPVEKSKTLSANGKPKHLYFLSSLSPQAQMKYASGSLESTSRQTPTTLALFASAPAPEEKPAVERVSIPEHLRPQTDQRFHAIRPLLDFRKNRQRIDLEDGRVIDTLDELAAYVGSQQQPPVSRRTMRRWLDRWLLAQKKGLNGYTALAKNQRSDAKGPGSRTLSPIARAYVENKYLNRNEGELWMWDVWKALNDDWSTVLGEKGQPPSYVTVRKYLNDKVGVPVKTLGRVGPEAFLARCTPFIIRSKQPVMKTWISDHRVHDNQLRKIWFAQKREELEENYRIWITAIVDMGSQAIVGYCFSPQPNWTTIHSAIRMAVLQYGFPEYFYWDNGQDFKKAKRQLQPIEVSKEILGFDFQVVSALPKRPRSKPIEAYFTRFSKQLDRKWGDSYLGNDPKKRREFARMAERAHKRYLEGKDPESPLPTDAQFIRTAIQWIEEYNNTKFKPLGWRTPNELMEEAWPERNRPKVNPRALDILLWEPHVATVYGGGMVKMDHMWYEPTEQYLYTLGKLQDQKILILRDPYNLGDAVAVTESRSFIGELRLKEFVDQDPANPITRAQISAQMKEQRRWTKMNSQHLALLSLCQQRFGWKTELEKLQARAGVLTGTDGRLALPAGAPGAGRALPLPKAPRATQPAFVSDAVDEDADYWRNRAAAPVED